MKYIAAFTGLNPVMIIRSSFTKPKNVFFEREKKNPYPTSKTKYIFFLVHLKSKCNYLFVADRLVLGFREKINSNTSSIVANKAIRTLIPFTPSYLRETGFSALAAIKTQYGSRPNAEKEMRF